MRQNICPECAMAKSHNLLFSASISTVLRLLELIYSDVWGLARLFLLMDLVITFVFWMLSPNLFGYFL